jgi:hypothetical protein
LWFCHANIEQKINTHNPARKLISGLTNIKGKPEGERAGSFNKKGEGRFSFTFLRREISPATLSAAFTALYIEIYPVS